MVISFKTPRRRRHHAAAVITHTKSNKSCRLQPVTSTGFGGLQALISLTGTTIIYVIAGGETSAATAAGAAYPRHARKMVV